MNGQAEQNMARSSRDYTEAERLTARAAAGKSSCDEWRQYLTSLLRYNSSS